MAVPAEISNSTETLAQLRHRLRTPLHHILGYSEMLLEEAEPGTAPQVITSLKTMHGNARKLLNTLSEALGTGKQDASTEDLNRVRELMLPKVREIVQNASLLVSIAPQSVVVDLLRILAGTAELLDFAQGKKELVNVVGRKRSESVAQTQQEINARVLIVDDDEVNRDILSRQLQRMGFSCLVARDGEDAMRMVARDHFDIALVDFLMPGMNGLDVLQGLKSNVDTQDIPVLMISAMDDLSGASTCIERGADDYLFKPFDPVLLNARIRAALDRARLRIRERERTMQLERISYDLERSNEDLNRFAYAASHDLQAPLRTITTHLQLLERRLGDRLDQDDVELLRFPVEAAVRMSHLIKDLLTFSQVSTDERPVLPVDCTEILSNTVFDLATAIEESHATITPDALPTVMADAVLLRQLFLNLLGNAIKYRGDAPPIIHVGVKRESSMWHFCVSDNGVGIPPAHIEDVFDMFKRLHGHDRPGTGLGLAICKRIIERLGGRIWAESHEGAGSTFHFTIPALPAT